MAVRNYSNTAVETSLVGGINNSDTSLVVGSTTGFPASTPYTLALDFDAATQELVEVTAVAGTTLTVTRGVDNTSAQSHANAAAVAHVISKRDVSEPNAHIAASTDVHGLAGGAAVVGTSSTQTLTNKTMSGASNTFTAIPASTALTGNFGIVKAVAPAATDVPLIAKGAAAQSANLFEARNSAEAAQFTIDPLGKTLAGGGLVTGDRLAVGTGDVIAGVQAAVVVDSTEVGLRINNTGAGTASALEIQDNGTSRLVALKTGQLTQSTGKVGFGAIGAPAGQKLIIVNDGATTDDVLVVKGVASQSANLQEWQSSDGAEVASVSAVGTGTFFTVAALAATIDAASDTVVLTVKGHSTQTSNMQEWKNDAGTALARISGTGYLAAFVPICTLTRSGAQTITTGTFTAIGWDGEGVDNAGGHDNATNNSRYTVQQAGYYRVSGTIEWAGSSTGIRDVAVRKNAVATNYIFHHEAGLPASDHGISFGGIIPVSFAVNDYLEVFVQHSVGANHDLTADSHVSIEWVSS